MQVRMLEQCFALLAVAVILEGAVDTEMDDGQVSDPRYRVFPIKNGLSPRVDVRI